MTEEAGYGFVYIWLDRKHKRYYIGSHWGYSTDGYICSSTNMRNNYNNRPNDFKRRVIKLIYTNRQDLLNEEQRWLDIIPKDQFNRKYYNKNAKVSGYWWVNKKTRSEISEKMKGNKNGAVPCSPEKAKKISETKRRKFEERRAAGLPCYEGQALENIKKPKNKGMKHTDEWKQQNSERMKQQWETGIRNREEMSNRMLGNKHAISQ